MIYEPMALNIDERDIADALVTDIMATGLLSRYERIMINLTMLEWLLA